MSAASADDFTRAVNRIMKTGKNIDIDSAKTLVRKFGSKAVLKGISSKGVISEKTLKQIGTYLNDPDVLKRLAAQEELIIKNAFENVLKNKDIKILLKSDGTFVRGDYEVDDLVRYSGKSRDEIAGMVDDVNVKNAATTNKSDLIKLGISGSLVIGVVFLMLITGKNNPVEAIAEGLKKAAETAADAGSDIFKNLFSGLTGFFNVSAMFLLCSSVGLVIWLVLSVVLKK